MTALFRQYCDKAVGATSWTKLWDAGKTFAQAVAAGLLFAQAVVGGLLDVLGIFVGASALARLRALRVAGKLTVGTWIALVEEQAQALRVRLRGGIKKLGDLLREQQEKPLVKEPLDKGKPSIKPKLEETIPTKTTPHKPLTPKQRAELNKKLKNRTITKEEYNRLEWDRRFNNRRSRGVSRYWAEERRRLRRGEKGTRQWTPEQREDILKGKVPKHNGEPIEGHHKYNALDHPQVADDPTNIYPATKLEHLKRWHGGDFKNDTKGVPLDPTHIEDF